MKLKNYLLLCGFIILNHFVVNAQVAKPFTPRFTAPGGAGIKGDLVFVGNNIINRTANAPTTFDAAGEPTNLAALTTEANLPYNVSANNNGQNFEYIDIDGDPTTFSSSRADLAINNSCKKIVYAGLYWTASYPYERYNRTTPIKTDWNQIKFKIPGGAYINIVADNAADPVGDEDDIILDIAYNLPAPPTPNPIYNRPYVCYKNVTALLQGLANADGQYFVANQRASRGENPVGNSGGWGMVVIYESPTVPSKYITTFDGYANIVSGDPPVNFNVNGFKTLPPPFPVRANIGVSALEGDTNLTGDNLRIKANSVGAFTTLSNTLNPANNFFNGTITNNNVNITNRLPASSNTLGFDLDIVAVNNPGNAVIPNNETGATFQLTTGGDSYGAYLTSFAVDIIAPDILLTKTVENAAGQPIGNADVTLCQDIIYVIGFQNTGNDNATNFTIKDIIPVNVTFNPVTDLILPPGVTFVSYTPGTRQLILSINNSLVEQNDPRYEIRIKVKVVCSCFDLDDACSNVIKNQAFATYNGQINPALFSDEGSIASFGACNIATPSSTNALVGLDNCSFTRDVVFCGTGAVGTTLTAAPGYASYTWSGPAGVSFLPNANSQTVTLVNPVPGVYTVNDVINLSPCKNITETINLVPFAGGNIPNPILPYNENLPALNCPNNGQVLPYIYLCGLNDTQLLQTNITGATSVQWQQLTGSPGCPVAPVPPNTLCLCPNETATTWTNIATGPNYTVAAAGEYRIVVTFQGGCTRTFYFNVTQNLLNPTAVVRDKICTTLGQITVNNVPGGYQYSLTNSPYNWQPSNIFTGLGAGLYTVYISQIGVANGCIFTVPNLLVRDRNMTVTPVVTQPLCFGDKGSVQLAANNVEPQYVFSVSGVGTIGPINSNTQQFNNLNPGTYTWTVTTIPDGCNATGTFTIVNPPQLTVTAAITKPLLPCSNGEITIYPVGGTPSSAGPPPVYTYNYIINGGAPTSDPVIVVPSPGPGGVYNIVVVDPNNCRATTSITISPNPPPVFTVTNTNVKCNGDNTGTINFNVTNANGFTLGYSINGTAGPFVPSSSFSNLLAGTYSAVIQYSLAGVSCTTTPQAIIITEPAVGLTASGGVAAVACATNGGNAIVRVTNPQGGTPFPGPPPYYEYSSDGITYGTSNTFNLAPGTYTLYIRDLNGCIFPMPVVVDPIPALPTITVAPPVFNCNGSATTTVTVNNPNNVSYTYTYAIDGVLNTPPTSNVFTNVACGPHNIAVNYTLVSPPTFSNLLNETFGSGANTTSPGIAAAYCFNSQPYPPGQPCGDFVAGFPASSCGNWFVQDNQYVVTKALNPNNCAWFDYRDHTSNGTNPNGRFLAVNIGSAAGPFGILYSKTINSVIPNQPVIVELYVANLLRVGVNAANPDFILELVNSSGTVIATQNVGTIFNTVNGWQFKTLTLNPGANTTLTFNIRSGSILYNGNDAAIDDIKVFQLPVACLSVRNFPINVACNQAFTANVTGHSDVTCAGANNGTITVAAQNFNTSYQVSLTGPGGYNTYFTSPVTIPVPTGYTGTVLIRYDATPGNAACSFSIPQVIITPAPITVTAITTPVTCLTGSTITATATGGNSGYQYQLINSVTSAIVFPFQGPNTFVNVPPGTYIVNVIDAKNCTGASTVITINPPVSPILSLNAASDFCYNGIPNSASIQVNVTGGTAPFQYYVNNNLFISTPALTVTIPNLTPGVFDIKVVDAFGCIATLPTQTIAPQLTIGANIIKGLDCTATPNATIQGSINGGYPIYTVTVNGITPVPVTGSTFTYSAATAGPYIFTVTDTRGCVATVTQTVLGISPPTVVATSPTVINCAGDSTGSLIVTPSGGVGPYQINVVRNTPLPVTTYGTQVNNLPAGNYTITVTDANSCTGTTTVNILEKPAITFTETVIQKQCTPTGTVLGSISTGVITGGTGPYTVTLYSTSSAPIIQTTAGASVSFNNLIPDAYIIEVVDANSCRRIRNVILTDVQGLIINTSQPTPTCATGATIVVTVVAAAGGPYSFGIANGSNIAPYTNALLPADIGFPLQHTFNNLTANTLYTFVVYDATTNCYTFQTATTTVVPLTNMTAVISNVNCIAAPGAVNPIQFTVSNYNAGTTAVNYQVFIAGTTTPVAGASGTLSPPTATSPIINMPFAGNFYIQLVEVNPNPALNGCSTGSGNFTTTNAPIVPLTLSVSNNINANCNQPNALVTVQGFGGAGAPYTYAAVPTGNPAPLPGAYSATNPLSLNTGTALSWDVYVSDATGCVKFITVPVAIDPLPTVIVPPFAANQCTSTGSYTFTVTGSGLAPLTYAIYSINGTLQAPLVYQGATFTVNSPGSYQIIVKDKNGCTALASNGPLVIYPPLSATASFTTPPVCNNANGVITMIPSGGSGVPNYSYSIVPAGPILVGNTYTNVAPGNYTITVTDNITTCTYPVIVNLAPAALPTFTLLPTPVVCIGDSNGIITVNLNPGNTDFVYQYAITAGPVVRPNQNSNVFTGLPTGSYTVQVTSGRGCPATLTVTVGQPTPIVIPAPVVTQFNCTAGTNATNFATITVNAVTGGSGTYTTYEFIPPTGATQTSTSNIFIYPNLTGGIVTINVYDDKGCKGTTTATINPFIAIANPTVTVTSPITCTTNESIQVTVATSGGPAPVLNYTLNTIPFTVAQNNTTGLFTNLPVGDYTITVTNPTTGCSVSVIHFVYDPNTFAATATTLADVTCFGGTNGSVSLTYVDNVLPNNAGAFSYVITGPTPASGNSPTAGPFTVPTGLAAGTYSASLTLAAAPNCTVTTSFSIAQPATALDVIANSTPITCVAGNNDGTITAVATGGWTTGPYQYQLVGPINVAYSTNNVFIGLTPGLYTINVRDAKGCIDFTTVNLTIPATINATVTAGTLACFGDTTSITIANVTGGQGSNYSYTIKGPLPSTITSGPVLIPAGGAPVVVPNIPWGSYEVEITDGWTCKNNFPVNILNPTPVVASLATVLSPTCLAGGSLTLTGTGGTGPYTYSTNAAGPFSAATFASTVTIPNLPAGTYHYFIKDANGCLSLVSNDVEVPVVVPMSILSLSDQDISCGGSNTGSINIVAQNGLGGYVYQLFNGPTLVAAIQLQPGVFTNLAAGTYTVLVTGNGGCSIRSIPIVISEPPVFTVIYTPIDAKCFGDSNGGIRVQVSGGTGITPPSSDFQYALYAFGANSGAFFNMPSSDFILTGLGQGFTYQITIKDRNGCLGNLANPYTFTVGGPAAPVSATVNVASIINETCLGDNNGGFTVTGITGGTGPGYTISLSLGGVASAPVTINNNAGPGTHVFSGLGGGTYTYIVTDSRGCPFDREVIIKRGVDMIPEAVVTFPCVNNQPAVLVEVQNDSNVPSLTFDPASEYTFVLTPILPAGPSSAPQASNVFTSATHPILLTPGKYKITVTNINGCIKDTQLFDILATDIDALTLVLSQGGLNEIVATSTGGSGGNTYVFNGEYNGSDNTYVYDATGDYTVTVTDSSGCSKTVTQPFVFIPIRIPDFFTPNGDGTNPTWSPQNTANYPNLKTYIYDRYGRKVKELNEGESWDGKYEGKELPSGDYWYVIKVNGDKDASEYVGHFTLYR